MNVDDAEEWVDLDVFWMFYILASKHGLKEGFHVPQGCHESFVMCFYNATPQGNPLPREGLP